MQQRSRKSWVTSRAPPRSNRRSRRPTPSSSPSGSTRSRSWPRRTRTSWRAKVVVDPSNPIGVDENGEMTRTLPDDQSAGALVAAMLPTSAHYVKAFGSLGADSLASAANHEPRRAVLFYATDDDAAAAAIERPISAARFD